MANFKKIRIINLLILIITLLIITSCRNSKSNVIESSNVNLNEEVKTSTIANENWFKDNLHEVVNYATYTSMVVRGDGKIITKAMDPRLEEVGITRDISGHEYSSFAYKNFHGDFIKITTVSEAEMDSYSYKEPSIKTIVYDKDGKEVGLEFDNLTTLYSTDELIIYAEPNKQYGKGKLEVYNVNTREKSYLSYPFISILNGKFILYTDAYSDDENEPQEILIVDDKLNEMKKIRGYSLYSVIDEVGFSGLSIIRREKDENGDFKRYYNYLDENFEKILDEDVEATSVKDKYPIVTITSNDKIYDFNIKTKEMIGEYKTKDELKNQNSFQYDYEKYDLVNSKIKDLDNYDYVNTFISGDKVLFFAYEENDYDNYLKRPCDIYNEKLEKLLEVTDMTNYWNDAGYIFVNYDTVYDIDLNVIKIFDSKGYLEMHNKFDKVFFTNNSDTNFKSKDKFEVYDKDFNILYDNVKNVNFYTYNDYIVLTDKDGTKFIDKDLNVTKLINRELDINGWYNDSLKYNSFTDLSIDRMGIIDDNYNIVVDKIKTIGALKEEYFIYQNGFNYGFMDYEGNPILTFSIFDTMTEDSVREDFELDYVEDYADYD